MREILGSVENYIEVGRDVAQLVGCLSSRYTAPLNFSLAPHTMDVAVHGCKGHERRLPDHPLDVLLHPKSVLTKHGQQHLWI